MIESSECDRMAGVVSNNRMPKEAFGSDEFVEDILSHTIPSTPKPQQISNNESCGSIRSSSSNQSSSPKSDQSSVDSGIHDPMTLAASASQQPHHGINQAPIIVEEETVDFIGSLNDSASFQEERDEQQQREKPSMYKHLGLATPRRRRRIGNSSGDDSSSDNGNLLTSSPSSASTLSKCLTDSPAVSSHAHFLYKVEGDLLSSDQHDRKWHHSGLTNNDSMMGHASESSSILTLPPRNFSPSPSPSPRMAVTDDDLTDNYDEDSDSTTESEPLRGRRRRHRQSSRQRKQRRASLMTSMYDTDDESSDNMDIVAPGHDDNVNDDDDVAHSVLDENDALMEEWKYSEMKAAYTWELRYRQQEIENHNLKVKSDNLALELADVKTLLRDARAENNKLRMGNVELRKEVKVIIDDRDEMHAQYMEMQQKLAQRDRDVERLLAQLNLLAQVGAIQASKRRQDSMIPEETEIRVEGMDMVHKTYGTKHKSKVENDSSGIISDAGTALENKIVLGDQLSKLRNHARTMFKSNIDLLATEKIDPSFREPTPPLPAMVLKAIGGRMSSSNASSSSIGSIAGSLGADDLKYGLDANTMRGSSGSFVLAEEEMKIPDSPTDSRGSVPVLGNSLRILNQSFTESSTRVISMFLSANDKEVGDYRRK